jgi:putative membrane protein
MFLSSAEANSVATRIADVEARTGVQVVVAVVGRAARYPEARWKAFALGVSASGLIIGCMGFFRPEWTLVGSAFGDVVAVLATGIVNALVATYLRSYQRAFVRDNRAAVEVRQYAEGLFLARELFATPARTAVLIVVSLFERAVVVHADRGFTDRVATSEWEAVVAPMTVALRSGDRAGAWQAGLAALQSLLVRRGFVSAGAGAGGLPDRPIEERGA